MEYLKFRGTHENWPSMAILNNVVVWDEHADGRTDEGKDGRTDAWNGDNTRRRREISVK